MKILFAFAAFCISTAAFSQNDSAEFKARRVASFKAMAPHGYLTVFIGEDINDATVPVQFFLDEKMNMTVGSTAGDYKVTQLKGGASQIRIVFHDKISYNTPQKIILTAIVDPAGKSSIIRSINFSGSSKRIIDFFVKYWNTSLQFPDGSGTIAERNMPGEKAVLLNDHGNASIKIEKL